MARDAAEVRAAWEAGLLLEALRGAGVPFLLASTSIGWVVGGIEGGDVVAATAPDAIALAFVLTKLGAPRV